MQVGSPHLFLDWQGLSNWTDVEVVLGSVQKDNAPSDAIIHPEFPWETTLHFYTSLLTVPPPMVLPGGPTHILYYACSDTVLFFNPIYVCAATSSDNGTTWSKPLLPYYPYMPNNTASGPTPTNRVWVTPSNEFLGNVFVDGGPAVQPGEEFKMAYEAAPGRQVWLAASSDGLQWRNASTPIAIAINGFADTQVALTWDAGTAQYVAFGRLDLGVPNTTAGCQGGYGSERHVMVSYAPVLTGPWSTPAEVVALGPPGDPLNCFDNYNPALITLPPCAGDATLLLPSEFVHFPIVDSRAPTPRAAGNDGVMDVRLVAGRNISAAGDGGFAFVSRDAFLPRGVGTRDPVSGLWNGTAVDVYDADTSGGATTLTVASEPDAGFVFATTQGVIDTGIGTTIKLLYWGSQTTHGEVACRASR